MSLQRRVHGLETEYGLAVQVRLQTADRPVWRRLGADEAARVMFRPMTTSSASTNAFLRNGGRLYLDVGSHPEYATAECSSIADLIAHERAGDRIVSRLASRAVADLADEGTIARVQLYRNNVDAHGNSWGSHENHLVRRDQTLRSFASSLTGFLACRQLLCGAGTWVRDDLGRGRLWLSQRARHLWDPVSSTTTRTRPMINTRDEPHADPQTFRRLHIISGDSNLAEPTVALRIGSTELMLRAIEDGATFDQWQPADTAAAIRQVASDLTGRTRFELTAGRTTCALELLSELHEAVADHTGGEPELIDAHHRWGEVVAAIDDGGADAAVERLGTWVDWAIKLKLLRGFADRHRVGPDDARLADLDLAFHDVHEGQGLFARAERAGQVERLLDEARIELAVERPPGDTRAALRSRLITAAQKQRRDHTVDWMTFTARDLPDGTVVMPDPLVHDDPRVGVLIDRMATEPRLAASQHFIWPEPGTPPHLGPSVSGSRSPTDLG